jgi:hypothetical protein
MYLYAFVSNPHVPLRVTRGLDGSQLSLLQFRDLGVVTGPIPAAFVRPGEDSLWRHGRVIEGLLEERGVLPLHFGTTVADLAEIRLVLARLYDRLLAALAKLDGRRECTVRVLSDVRLPDAEAAALAAELHRTLALSADDYLCEVLTTPRLLLTGTYLIEESRLDAFLRQTESLSAVYPGLRLLFSGPAPAYSFVPALDDGATLAAEQRA